MSKKPRKPTKAQSALLDRARQTPVVVGIDESGERHYSLANGGGVNARTAKKCIERGFLVPQGDGLFGDSQTFVPSA